MLIANLSNGRTLRFDLSVKDERQKWQKFLDSSNGQITALAISSRKNLHTFPRPYKLRTTHLGADVIKDAKNGLITAERIWCHCGKVRVILTVYTGKVPVSRIDVRQIGEIRFQPRRQI